MTDTPNNNEAPRDYRETLFLPKTDFPMRAGLPRKEPEWLAHWDKIDLYNTLRKQSKDKPTYVLHDGPPYANGHIHIGTAMNKILKDIVVKAHQGLGYNANYVPGWDCHGLPIEWKVEEEFRGKGRTKDQVPGSEFRKRCREYAGEWLGVQREEFKRLGVIGDWDNPYKTMEFKSESIICGELLKIASSGQLYRGSKPIMWSPVERTALAEAEVEYADRRATQIYVKFPVHFVGVQTEGSGVIESIQDKASIVIWTTTPWTIPANRAVSFSPNLKYGLYEVTEMQSEEELGFKPWAEVGERFILADTLSDSVKNAAKISSWTRIMGVDPRGYLCFHPLKNMEFSEGKFDFWVPLLSGQHVTGEAGTGFVHTAPSHGEDDYAVWMSNQKQFEKSGYIDPVVPMTLDDDGCYTDIMPERFQGLDVIRTSGKKRGQDGKANPEVLKALMECGNLLARGITMLRDAHSWRSKAPVIRRATPQWFVSMSKDDLRGKALAAIKETTWYPARGENRIRAMVEDRPDWLISRQRNWGVPITLMVDADGALHTERADADAINARILAAVEAHGVDGWFDTTLETFMPDDNDGWTKVTDILDVWFDSGSTHAFCLKQRDDLEDRADLYLEGTDQHRGWFQSSLLESCANYGEAPYKAVLTHGFVMAEDGRKMSKSLGNTIAPEQIIRQYGADILRLWVASSDFTDDLRIGDEIIKTAADAYRKLRNTLRYMIGALDGYDTTDAVDYSDMPALEKWVLHRLSELDGLVKVAYKTHDFKKVYSALFNFCTNDLSAFYFDIRKDALYCDPLDSTRRRACRTVMDKLFNRLTLWLAPILSFTMEEVWQTRYNDENGSVHLHEFPDNVADWNNDELAANMKLVLYVRESVNEVMEPKRAKGEIRSSLEGSLTIDLSVDYLNAIKSIIGDQNFNVRDDDDGRFVYSNPENPNDTLADYLIVSRCVVTGEYPVVQEIIDGEICKTSRMTWKVGSLRNDPAYTKCERSWKYFKAADGATITPRDVVATEQWDAKNG
ncbi:MAG: isoleucine--tRNA ligase [Robiginitomaculum sp.]|nr:isoleucine--tRNA ligase [Robiginitomaculum sp.]